MKKIISLILSVTMLASAAQLYVSADIVPEAVQSEAVQESGAQSTSRETTETVQSASIQKNTAANTLIKSGYSSKENTSIFSADSGANLGNDFYARIKYTGSNGVERVVSAENDGNVDVKKATNAANQIWRFIRQSDGYYKIQNNLNSLYLTVQISSTTPEKDNNVVVYVANESDVSTQKWSISAYEGVSGKYEIRPAVKPEQRLDADNGYSSSADVVSNIHTYTENTTNHTQEFSIEKVFIQPQLSDDFFGMLSFTVTNNGTTVEKNVGVDTAEGKDNNVKMFTPTASNDIDLVQYWHFIKQSDGSYKIKNMHNGHYLYAGEKAEGEAYGNVKVAVDDNSDSIRWNIYQSVDNSKYVFIPFSYPGKALEVDKGTSSLSDETNVHLWENNPANLTQEFAITNMMTLADVGKDLYAQIGFSESYISYNPVEDNDNVVIYKESELPQDETDGSVLEENKTKQIWRFVRKDDGSYYITNMNNGKYLTINSKSTNYGANIEAVSPADNMSNICSWFLYSIDGKYVFIPDYTDNRVIYISEGATADGTEAQSYFYNGTAAQKFTLSVIMNRAEELSDDFYAKLSFTNESITKYLSLSDNNAVVNTENDSLNQNWRFFRQSDGSYRISNMSNGKCLYVDSASTESETNVWVCDENNSDAQRWFIYKNNDNKYVFKAACAPKTTLDVTGRSTADGTNVQMYTYNGSIAQEFTFHTIMTKASLGDDFYANISFVNGTNSENISVSGDSAVVYEKNGSTQQNWHFIKQSDGSYKIVNMYYGYGNCLCAFVSPDSTQTFSEINVNISADDGKYAQRWYIYEINGKYVFKLNCSPNTALEVNNQSKINVDNVLMKTYNGNASQLFEINQGNSLTPANIGDNFNAYINIDKKNADYGDGNRVIANTIDNQSSKQKWNFVRQTSGNYIGSYEIKNINDNVKCMDVGSGSSAAGAGVHIYEDNDTAAQRWYIFAQSGKYVLRAACAPNNALTLNSSNNNIYMDKYTGDISQTFAIEKLITESDISTVSSDNIKFQLFNYNENINRIGGMKNSDGTDNWRPLAKYFSFLDRTGYINGCPTPKDWFDVSGWYDADGFAVNHATVEPKLKDNYPVIRLDNKKNADGTPATDPQLSQNDRSLGYLFGSEKNNKAVESYYPTNTILQKEDNANGVTHYYYNSTTEMKNTETEIGIVTDKTANAVDYDFERNKFALRDYTEADRGDIYWSSIFPFNTADSNSPINEYSKNREFDNPQVDYWFGMRMDVDFIQSADGKMSASENMVFNFTGDDDVWVFIDDVLVLDIGGRHTAVKGTINFATGEINTLAFKNPDPKPQYTTNLYKQFEEAGVTPNGGWKTTSDGKKIFADYTSHKMSFFYLERATGVATCTIDFNMPTPPENTLAVTKQVKDSNGNNVDGDNTTYTFLLKNKDGTVITSASEEANYQRYVNGQLTDTTVDKDGIFKLKNGESVYFKQLDSKKTYIIEEIDNQSYVKSTDVYVDNKKQDGYVDVGGNRLSPSVSVTPASESTKNVKFTNTIKSVDITFKYYGRETVNGKPADIKKEPTTYTRTILANDTNFTKYFDGTVSNDPIVEMIVAASTNLTPDNLLDTYKLWTSQSYASGANENTGIKYFATTNDSSNPYYTIVNKNYADFADYQYHADRYGKPVQGEKWVTYYNSSGTEVDYESNNSLDVTKVSVWLFNTPKQYTVTAYEGKKTGTVFKQVGDKYVVSGEKTKTIQAYYNQRLGLAIDDEAEYSKATNHLSNYGIDSYVGTKLETAASIKKDENTTLKFAYWAFDPDGKNIASTDINYNYRIVAKTTLYAVYTESGTVNDGNPGLTVSENERDIFFNSSGTSITRLNTQMNPYNCQNKDTNITNVAIVYVIDKNGNLVSANTADMRTAIKDGLDNAKKDNGSIRSNNTYGSFTITLQDGLGNKCNYFAFVINDSSGITLTNKNRIEFGSTFQTEALYKDGGKRMYAFAAMYYTDAWIVSDNFIDYNFTATSTTAE